MVLYWRLVVEIFYNITLEFGNSRCQVLKLVAVSYVVGFQPLLHCVAVSSVDFQPLLHCVAVSSVVDIQPLLHYNTFQASSFSICSCCGEVHKCVPCLSIITKTISGAHSRRHYKSPCLISKWFVALSEQNMYQTEAKHILNKILL